MNIGWNIESFMTLSGTIITGIGSIIILKKNWKQYGILYLASTITGHILCLIFLKMHFYSYPYHLFPKLYQMPFTLLFTMFPFYVLLGVRYSPISWKFKIPFYWVIVHIGVFGEVLAENFTEVIKYNKFWDTWDSYTWWWIFLLFFELLGSQIVSQDFRKPISEGHFKYSKLGWYLVHFILVVTIFFAGYYLGSKL